MRSDQHKRRGNARRRRGGEVAAPPAGIDDAARAADSGAQPTQDLNVVRTQRLVDPRQVKRDLPMTAPANRTVIQGREEVKRILSGEDERLLVVVGPCSIHDEGAALEYAERLVNLRRELADRLCIVMRVYFEKPRTTVGWKGLIYDPHLDGSFDIESGIRLARSILLRVTELGLPAATEMLDPITPQYIADLVTWSAIGARTTESQTHRQMASGLSMPVGFKNSTEGRLQTALDAMAAARQPHAFLGIDENGLTAIIHTRGNAWAHVILRGGRNGPNYDPATIDGALEALRAAGLPSALMVDCSHANANKQFKNQPHVWRVALMQRLAGKQDLIGLMLESNLFEGSQKLGSDPSGLRYGISITDQCLGWDESETLLREAHTRLGE